MRKSLFSVGYRSVWGLLLVLLPFVSLAQTRTITGQVTDRDGVAIPMASVSLKGTTRGTTTNAQGDFSVKAATGDVLVFNSVGYRKAEVRIGAGNTLNVTLEDDLTMLDETVVTALGISQQQRALGTSAPVVKGEEIADTRRQNVMMSLAGRVPGLQITPTTGLPGSSVQIQLRGASSIGGNNSPLFVIDGLPVSNNTFNQGGLVTDQPNRGNDYMSRIGDLNPNDIESVTVLKGIEAAALYGSEGASGVIVITTKKGTRGNTKVTYDNQFQLSQAYRFLETQQVWGQGLFSQPDPNSQSYFGPRYTSEQTAQTFDNMRNFYQDGKTMRHNIGIEGGQAVTYRFSASYTDQTGIIPTTGMSQLQTRLTGSAKVKDKLTITNSFALTSNNITKAFRGATGAFMGMISWPAVDDMRNYLTEAGTRRRLFPSLNSEIDNPYFNLYQNRNGERTIRMTENISATYKITPWLNATARFGFDTWNSILNTLVNPESSYGEISSGIVSKGFISEANDVGRIMNGNFLVTAEKNFGKFKTSYMVGTSVDDNRTETNAMYGERLYLPTFNSINNTDNTTQRGKKTIINKRLQAVFGSIDLNYNDIWYTKITGRNDWSSALFGAEQYSYFYPSVNTSVVLTSLPFLKNQEFITFAKIRASYAQTGKDPYSPYKILPTLTPQTTTDGGFAYGFWGGNTNLKPERGEGIEIGTDWKFMQNRLSFEANYYQNRRFNQIVTQRLSYGTGFIFGLLNGGSYRNQGVELQLSGDVLPRTSPVGWNMNLNFSRNLTFVESLPAEVIEYYNSDTWLYNNARASAFVGMDAIRSFYPNLYLQDMRGAGRATAIGGFSYLRNKNGDILIDPSSGIPLRNTNFLPIGDRNPDFVMGFRNTFSYKNATLSFLLDLRKGGDVFNGNEMFLFSRGLSTRTIDRESPVVFKGVLRDGYENSDKPTVNNIQITPATNLNYYSALAEEDFVERDVNWLRLRDITLSYKLGQNILSKGKFIKEASIYFTGTDLFLLTNYNGADPSVNGTTATSLGIGAFGMDFGTVATPRTFSTGLRLSF